MARKKSNPATLVQTDLGNGMVRLTSPYPIMDVRTERIHSEVVCGVKKVKYFVEVKGE